MLQRPIRFMPETALGIALALWLLFLSACYYPRCPVLVTGDHGRDLHAFLLVREGKVPYRDFNWIYGPALPYYYAACMAVGGDHLRSVQAGHFLLLALAALATYRLALRLLSPPVALLAGLLLFFTAFVHHTYNAVGCTLAVAWTLERFLAWRAAPPSERFPAGVVAGVVACAAVKFNIGLALGAALLLADLLSRLRPPEPEALRGNRRFRLPLAWSGSAALLSCVIYGVFLVGLDRDRVAQALPLLGHLRLGSSSIGVQHAGGVAPPVVARMSAFFIESARALADGELARWIGLFTRNRLLPALLPFVLAGSAALALRAFVARRHGCGTPLAVLTLGLAAAALSAEFLFTATVYSLYAFPSPAVITLAVAGAAALCGRLERVRRLFLGQKGRVGVTAVVAGSALVGLLGALELGRHDERWDHPRLQVYVGRETPRTVVTRVTEYLDAVLRPGEPLLVLPYAPLYYCLLDRPNPLRADQWLLYNAFSPEEEASMVAALEGSGVRCVLETNFALLDNPLEGRFGVTHAVPLAAWLEANFTQVAYFGEGPEWTAPPDWARNHQVKVLWRKGAEPPTRRPR